jgi:hypothetical protein
MEGKLLRVLAGNSEGKRPLENVKTDLCKHGPQTTRLFPKGMGEGRGVYGAVRVT